MTPLEWLAREIAEQRLDAKPDGEVLAAAAAMIRRGNSDEKQRKRRKVAAR
jgi:hypothetical protein